MFNDAPGVCHNMTALARIPHVFFSPAPFEIHIEKEKKSIPGLFICKSELNNSVFVGYNSRLIASFAL